MENDSGVLEVNVSPSHDSGSSTTHLRCASARGPSPRRSPAPVRTNGFWNVTSEQKVEILKVNLEQHARTVDEQIRSLRQEFAPQKSASRDIAVLQEEVRQLRALNVPPSRIDENQIMWLKDALQELSLAVEVLKNQPSSRGGSSVDEKTETFVDGNSTDIATCTEVQVLDSEFEVIRSEMAELRDMLQEVQIHRKSNDSSVMKTRGPWRVSLEVSEGRLGTVKTDDAWLEPKAYYHFSNTVWVASLWVGVAPVAESVNTVVLITLNGLLQAYFCVLIALNMGARSHMGIEDDDLEGFLSWRTTAAHSFTNYDSLTNTSLASRVCGSWNAAIVSSDQIRQHESFDTYIGDAGILWGGPGLCMICLICWFFLVAVDVMDNLHCSVAMWTHWKTGVDTEVIKTSMGAFQFKHLGTLRVVLIQTTAVIPRFAIASMLFFQGARFLIYTQDPIELILNAIALGFILELDELTFDFLPETVRTAIMTTDPLEMTQNPRYRWMHMRPIFILLVAVASLGGLFTLIDVVDRIEVAQEILCGGDTDFVFAVDVAFGAVRTAKTDMLPEPDMESYKFFSVLQDLHLDWETLRPMSGDATLSWWSDYVVGEIDLTVDQTVVEIDEITKTSDVEALAGTACVDHDTDVYLLLLRETRGDESLMSCSDLALQCDDAEVRMFCALTCKCDTQEVGMYWRAGCSATCDTAVLAEVSEVADNLYGVGSDSSRCTSYAEGWQDTFMEELLFVLVSAGHLERAGASEYVWTASFVHEVNKIGVGRFYMSSEGLDMNTWLDTSVPSNLCDAIPYFDTLMGTSLCDTAASLDLSLGSLEGLCPQVCGLCDLEGSETRLVLLELYQKQGEDLISGLIDFPIFSENSTYETLSCGNITTGSTDSLENAFGNTSPDQIYQFYSSMNQTVVFSTCGTAEFDTLIRVLDVFYLEISNNDDFDGCENLTSYLEVTFQANELVYVLVEGYDDDEYGEFNLIVSC